MPKAEAAQKNAQNETKNGPFLEKTRNYIVFYNAIFGNIFLKQPNVRLCFCGFWLKNLAPVKQRSGS
jgi:hypothetical protein